MNGSEVGQLTCSRVHDIIMSLGDILTLPIQRNYIEREARCINLSLHIRAAAQPVAFSNVGRTGFQARLSTHAFHREPLPTSFVGQRAKTFGCCGR